MTPPIANGSIDLASFFPDAPPHVILRLGENFPQYAEYSDVDILCASPVRFLQHILAKGAVYEAQGWRIHVTASGTQLHVDFYQPQAERLSLRFDLIDSLASYDKFAVAPHYVTDILKRRTAVTRAGQEFSVPASPDDLALRFMEYAQFVAERPGKAKHLDYIRNYGGLEFITRLEEYTDLQVTVRETNGKFEFSHTRKSTSFPRKETTPFYQLSPTCQIPGLARFYEELFSQRGNGTFVEVGAFDGDYVSNSSGLADLGWTGHYVEPVPQFFKKCSARHARNPRVTVSNCAIGAQRGQITMQVGGPLSTALPAMAEHFETLEWAKGTFQNAEVVTAEQYTLNEFLKSKNVEPGFEILGMDIEGSEWAALEPFDIAHWRPQMVIIELHDGNPDYPLIQEQCAKIVRYFEQHQYLPVYKDRSNTIYVSREKLMSLHARMDYLMIWGHGLAHTDQIMSLIRRRDDLEIISIHRKEIADMPRFVEDLYACDTVPYEHLRAKTRYLMGIPQAALFILVRNANTQEKMYGDGEFRHIQCALIKDVKEEVRNAFNPRVNGKRSEDHVIHGSDYESHVAHALKVFGLPTLSHYIRRPHPQFTLPYHLESFAGFQVLDVPVSQLRARIIGQGIVPLEQTPHYAYVAGQRAAYVEYHRQHAGVKLTDDHYPAAFDKLIAKFDFNYAPLSGRPSHPVALRMADGTFFLQDGVHRAAILQYHGIATMRVIELLPAVKPLPLTTVIFSKDRALQLDATLRSLYLNCPDHASVQLTVLFTTSTARHAEQYETLRREHPSVKFIRENDFRADLLTLLKPAQHVLFVVDDCLFVRPFSFAYVLAQLGAYPHSIGFSLRLGRNTTYCYSFDRAQKLPHITAVGEDAFKFPWVGAEYDFGYPLEVSSSVYRTANLLPLLSEKPWRSPNSLEAMLSENISRFSRTLPELLSFNQSVAFCAPVNKVQAECANRAGTVSDNSIDQLAAAYALGQRVDVTALVGFTPDACHQEVPLRMLSFVPKPQARPALGPVGAYGHRIKMRTIAMARRRKWQAAVPEEVEFWDRYISTRGDGRWEKELLFRLQPDSPLQDYIIAQLTVPEGGTVKLLDVGAGPITFVGKSWPGRTVELTAVDPLAEHYAQILNRCDLRPPVPTQLAAGETLTTRFPLNHFDVVHARNCIDHSLDAPQSVDQMLAVTKPGGWVMLEHGICEATANNQTGLHSWNFFAEDGNFFIEAPGAERVNVTARYAGLAEVSCEIIKEKNWISVRMKKLLPTVAANARPTVSVVIPCYKQAQFLAEALESVAHQTFKDFEVIVVDDGSPDDTAVVARQLAAEYPTCHIVILTQPNGGLASARNTGIRAARGEFILPLDCDDKITPDYLAKTVAFLQNNPQVKIVGTYRQDFGASTETVPTAPYTVADIIQGNRNSYCSLYRREVWEAVGGYRTNMVPQGYEDWDFWVGAAEHGWVASFLPEPLFLYRVKSESMFTEAAEHDKELRAQIILNHPKLYTADQIAAAHRVLAGFDVDLSGAPAGYANEADAKAALQKDPNDVIALQTIAVACLEGSRWVEGAQVCQRILQQRPNDIDVLLCMARCFGETGDRETFSLVSRRVLELDYENEIARENLRALGEALPPRPAPVVKPDIAALAAQARQLAEEGRWTEALPLAQQVVSATPEDFNTRAILGRCYWEAGSQTTAELLWEEILERDPNNALIRAWLGGEQAAAAAPTLTPSPDGTPRISVIVPTYNRPDWLVETLKSILAQTFQDFEIIVVNDAGPDISSVIASLNAGGRIQLLTHEKNKGLAGARNTGIRAARGKYIAYLDDDDIFHPDHLATLVNHLESTGNPVAYTDAYRAIQRKQGDTYVITERDLPYSNDWDNDRVLVENFVPVLCFMHEKRCIEEAGWFDESLTTHEDWDLWIRMSRLFKFTHIKQITCEFRWRDDGSSMSSHRRADFLRTSDVIYRKYAAEVKNRPDLQIRCQQRLLTLSRDVGNLPGKVVPEAMLISIVIPVFNRLDMTRPCIEAIHRETAAGTFEIIVVDNASSDGTREFLAAEAAAGRLRTIRNEQNLGFAKATNQGILACRGGLVLLLNNDTVPLAGWLDAMLEEYVLHQNVGAVGSCLLYPGGELIQHAGVTIGAGGGSLHPYHPWRLQRLDRVPEAAVSRDRQVVTAACLLVRRPVIDEIGLLDEGFINGFEDVDFCFRIGQAGYRLRYCATSKVIHHESMTPGRSLHEQANYHRLNDRWKSIITPDESPEETSYHGVEIQCRERLISEPDNVTALAVLVHNCQKRGDHAQAAEFQARLDALKKSGKPLPVSVSIVIPVLNNLDLTRQCLEGIERAGGLTTTQIIVVDNASADGTPEYLQEMQRQKKLSFIRNEVNQGFARGCNQGAAAARGKFVLFLNNDTVTTPGWLDALWNTARKPDVGVVGSKLLYPDGTIQHAGIGWINGVPDHPGRNSHPLAPEVNTPRELDMVTGACFLMPRELFLQLGGFDEVYRNGVEDVDLCLRVRATGRKVCYQPQSVVFHLEGKSAGRFDHVSQNLEKFFARWRGWFDASHNFQVPTPPRVIVAEQSLFMPAKNAQPLLINWQGTFLDYGSLSHVNRELTDALANEAGIKIVRVQNAKPADDLPKPLRRYCKDIASTLNENAAITVRHSWPPDWNAPAKGVWVHIQPWEFGSLPVEWVEKSARVDEFWVYTEYVRNVYVDSGIPAEKVKVVPLGIDPKIFHPAVKPMALNTQKTFKFLFVGGTIRRKGPDVLLQAYLDTFTADDDVCLVIKDFGGQGVYAGQSFAEQIKTAQARPNAPEILYLTDELTPEAVAGLYTACDCLVHPYRGEGFGLPVLEAMACNLSVVVTAGGSTDDFATEERAYHIPSKRESIGQTVGGFPLVKSGWLLEPDAGALAQRLRWIVSNREAAKAKGRSAGEHVRRDWTWARAARVAAQRLNELKNATPASAKEAAPVVQVKPAKREQPAVVSVGQLRTARELLSKGELLGAWNSTLTAIGERPFHPEAYLLLAEIARAAGDVALATRCVERARQFAQQSKAVRQALKAAALKPVVAGLQFPPLPEPRKKPLLSVCLIVRNEEKFLGQCLSSIKDIAHQIVVVDTGSRDRTIEIAREFDAEVHSFPWCDDFSAARNAALEHATGDWVLSLDADEVLSPEGREALLREIQNPAVMAYRLPIVDVGREAEGGNYVPRLFRNAPGVHFVGRIHEQAFSSVETLRKDWGLENQLGTAKLLHYGYNAEVSKSRDKVERNLRLLKQAVLETPDDANLLMNLGLELVRSGNLTGGIEKYVAAFNLLAAQDIREVSPELRENLLTQLGTHLLAARKYEQVVQVLGHPLAVRPGLTASLHFLLGLAQVELRQFAPAAEQMRQCVAKRNQPVLAPVHKDIRSAAPNHCLAICLNALNQPAAAEAAFIAALKDDPQSRPVRIDWARHQAKNGQPVEALKGLYALVGEKGDDAAVWRLGGEISLSQPDFLEFARDWTGEACQAMPYDPTINLQRAEALLLSQDIANALPLWRRHHDPANRRHQAALAICEVLAGNNVRPFPAAIEKAVSQEAIKWYRQFLGFQATGNVAALNQAVGKLAGPLPSAAEILRSALQEAGQPAGAAA